MKAVLVALTAALAGLLPDSAMAKVDFDAKEKREVGSWEWYQPCTKVLPSNSRIIGGASAKWGDGKRPVVQIVDVYPPGVAWRPSRRPGSGPPAPATPWATAPRSPV